MSDAHALRQRRYRAHKRGDHSLCRPEACPSAGDGVVEAARVAVSASPGSVEKAVHGVLGRLSFEEGDPRCVMAAVALRLASQIDRGELAAAPLARELGHVLGDLTIGWEEDPGKLDEIRLKGQVRRLDLLLAGEHYSQADPDGEAGDDG